MTLVQYLIRKYGADHCTASLIAEYFDAVHRMNDSTLGIIAEYKKGTLYGRYDSTALYLIYSHSLDDRTRDRVIDLMRNQWAKYI